MSTAPTPSGVPEAQPTPVASASTDGSVAWLTEPQEAKDDDGAAQPVRQYCPAGNVAVTAAADESSRVEPAQEGSDNMTDCGPADHGAGHAASLSDDSSVPHTVRSHALPAVLSTSPSPSLVVPRGPR